MHFSNLRVTKNYMIKAWVDKLFGLYLFKYTNRLVFMPSLSEITNLCNIRSGRSWGICFSKLMKNKLLSVVLILALAYWAVDCQQNDVVEWQILTNLNFSSQIRLHPHILLLVTVPCTLSLTISTSTNQIDIIYYLFNLSYLKRIAYFF